MKSRMVLERVLSELVRKGFPPKTVMSIAVVTRGSPATRPEEEDSELEQIEASWHILAALRRFGPRSLADLA